MSIVLNGTNGVTTTGLTSNGIDDNATSTAITIASNGHTSISGAGSTSNNSTAEVLSVAGDNHVRQSISTSSTGGHQASLVLESNSNEVVIGTAGSNEMRFSTNAAERMRIENNGDLVLNEDLFVNRSRDDSHYANNTRSTSYQGDGAGRWWVNHSTDNGGGDEFLIFNYNTSEIGSIDQNFTTGVNYNTSSDYRLKENVVDLENATERLKQIPVRRFNFIANPDTTVDGFLAHEVQPFVPEAITGTKDAVDEEGNPKYQKIDHSKLVPLLVATIQELEARIAALETP